MGCVHEDPDRLHVYRNASEIAILDTQVSRTHRAPFAHPSALSTTCSRRSFLVRYLSAELTAAVPIGSMAALSPVAAAATSAERCAWCNAPTSCATVAILFFFVSAREQISNKHQYK